MKHQFEFVTDLRKRMQGLFKVKVFNNNNQVEDLQTEQKTRGCENPEALSSITMVEDGAAMKMIKIKNPLHSRRKTEKAIKDYK